MFESSIFQQAIETYRQEGVIQLGREGVLFATRSMVTDATFPVSMPLYVSIREKIQELAVRKALSMGFENRLSELNLREFKTSDTVFILGSGATINQISESGWEHINAHDSFGLNFWPIHEHVPSLYVFEPPIAHDAFCELLDYRREELSNIPIIIKDLPRDLSLVDIERYPDNLVRRMYLAKGLRIPWKYKSYDIFNRSIEWFDERGYFEPNGRIELGLKKRASVSFLIHMAVKMGYENIVLCGVDMNDSRYFYEEKREHFAEKGVPLPPKPDIDEDDIHRSNDPTVHRPILENILYELNDSILEPKEITLFTESAKSATYPRLPLYEK
ncbi:hypothetical protein PNQ29_11935 [Halobacterium salinarum]|uniref:hypothetical protein n=1 Tax=Halobacterium salinarum TaxID=2242 RepID=UPI0025579655|nr:hypothetical protein [Halobacterium salinarum]MDL0120429.1 hypothetical protein [Halobacterium salinarum]